MNLNDKCRVSFFVLGYHSKSLSHPMIPILVPIRFSAMQLVARKFCLAQPNVCYISLPTAHAVHRAQQYLLVHSSSQALALPTPRRFQVRRSGWGRPGSGQVRGPPPPRRTCAAGREVGALTSASPLCLRHQRRCRRRCCCCRAEAVAEAAVAVHWRYEI